MSILIRWISRSPSDTRMVGEALARTAAAGDFVALFGGLGAGKTEFVKGLAAGLGVRDPDLVCSPTFILAASYSARLPLRHVDAYRLRGPEDLEALGYEEWILSEGVTALEWAERARSLLPMGRIEVRMEHLDESSRRITCSSACPRGEAWIREASDSLRTLTET
ncbi:MAG: tRNA (adenosine(37)-N6)-threonylcarbamoyltransferase complex ATPase subunit type 1 TsaE [Planctomycetes bacterium]|jgi:tRNA threonylcarbamoyladenosine biosynthesis protein TsaE|nr:tRNA (adenosine(37)-N6)-threonylcarbamoyltransferase complex ATPase subunit type 1 TsaE [Planctomycetota bacterium]